MGGIALFFFCAFSTVTLVCPCEVKVTTTTAGPSEKDTAQLVTAINELKHMLTCPGGSLVDQLRLIHTRLQAAEEKLQAFETAQSEINDTLNNERCHCNSTRDVRPCRSGWTRFGVSCYQFQPNLVPYNQSKIQCEAKNSYLAEIESVEESHFVSNLTAASTAYYGLSYMGLNDMATEGVFVLTSSGRVATFTYWRSGEPNNDDGNDTEDCVAVPNPTSQFYPKWADVPCDRTTFSSVCEYSLE